MARIRRSRALRNASWTVGGLVLGIALAMLVLNLVARTRAGHERVLEYTLSAIGKSMHGGQLDVGRISGNLFEGARLYQVALREKDGTPFVLADSADVDYDIRTLLSPRIRITRLVLYKPDIYVRRLPGDSLWNYQQIFRDTTTGPRPPRTQRVTFVDSLWAVGGTVKVEIPWAPDSTTSERAQRDEVRLALRDTSPVIVRRVQGGYLRTINLTRVSGRLRQIRFAPGAESGSRLNIDSLRGRVQFFRRPADVRHLQGIVAILPDRVEFDAPVVRLPGTRIATSGVVCMRNDTKDCGRAIPRNELPYYDIAFRGDTVSFRDLQWMYPRFPSDARGKMSLFLETRPEGILFDIRGASFTAPGTRIDGSFGITVGDTIVFSNVDVRARPVRISTIERMLPEGLPVRGLVLGGATIRGSSVRDTAQ
jgi:hypothetical protein